MPAPDPCYVLLWWAGCLRRCDIEGSSPAAMSTALKEVAHAFYPRTTRWIDTIDLKGWQLKVYTITTGHLQVIASRQHPVRPSPGSDELQITIQLRMTQPNHRPATPIGPSNQTRQPRHRQTCSSLENSAATFSPGRRPRV